MVFGKNWRSYLMCVKIEGTRECVGEESGKTCGIFSQGGATVKILVNIFFETQTLKILDEY